MPDAQKSQLDKFKEAAHQLETGDDEDRVEKELRGIVKRKPTPVPKERELLGKPPQDHLSVWHSKRVR